MPLKLRPSGLGHGVYKDSIDYSVFSARNKAELAAAKALSERGVNEALETAMLGMSDGETMTLFGKTALARMSVLRRSELPKSGGV
jgi:hypothetical protein